ncbi:hypothetical protein TI39_contig337g00002 [Zymoseptoria brevis]|uniref:Uncharacterized protein n=1 Tax=Zymoseptoria brevis TaxID=1047168 RepID=A0A0F4GS85_9PEZI|nr:hypothetical protein TI39_contig337g00002 [Zymoseptoria brevis]
MAPPSTHTSTLLSMPLMFASPAAIWSSQMGDLCTIRPSPPNAPPPLFHPPCLLLTKLSAELRNVIYTFAFSSNNNPAKTVDVQNNGAPKKELLCCNRQIYNEAKRSFKDAHTQFWRNTKFHLNCSVPDFPNLQHIPDRDFNRVTKLLIKRLRFTEPRKVLHEDGHLSSYWGYGAGDLELIPGGGWGVMARGRRSIILIYRNEKGRLEMSHIKADGTVPGYTNEAFAEEWRRRLEDKCHHVSLKDQLKLLWWEL